MIRKREEYYNKEKRKKKNTEFYNNENSSSKGKKRTTGKKNINKNGKRTTTRNGNVKNQKRKVKNKPKTKKGSRGFTSKKGALLAALAITAAASFLYAKSREEDEYTRIATAIDVENDEYEKAIPISRDGNIVATVEDGAVVFVESKDGDNLNIRSITEDGEVIEGYTSEDYVKETGKIKTDELESYSYIYKVKDFEGHLNVRDEKSLDDETIVGKLYSEELVLGKEPMKTDENGISWVQILYDDNGEFKNAYISGEYVRIIGKVNGKEAEGNFITKQEEKELLEDIRVNENGQVIGIDVSDGVSPEQLEELLTNPNAIPSKGYRDEYNEQTKETEQVEYNLSDLQGKIDYVILKIGARGYGEEGNMIDYGDIYVKQAEVCEKYGVPYGFYFFSTAITYREAEEEVGYFKNALEKLGNRKYNLIPAVIDSEPAKGFRTYKEELTSVIALELNELEKYTGKPMLYTMGPNVASFTAEKNIDIEELNKQVESGPVPLWLSSHRRTDNSDVYGPEYLRDVQEQTTISMIQTANDIYNKEAGLNCKVDINMADKNELEKLIKRRATEIRGEAYSKEINKKRNTRNTYRGMMEGVSSELKVGIEELQNQVLTGVLTMEAKKDIIKTKEELKEIIPEITSRFFSTFVQEYSENEEKREERDEK